MIWNSKFPVESLGYVKCYNLSSPRAIENSVILSEITVRRSVVDQEVQKPYWQSEQKTTFLEVINRNIYRLFKDFTNNRRKTNRVIVLSCRYLTGILKHKNDTWNLPAIWKQDAFRHILKSSGSMYENFRLTIP